MNIAKAMVRIGTHSGVFHCDEALAVYMLRCLPDYKDAEILRSRDPEKLADCDIVVDVGGEFDPSRHRYDHHQRGFEESMKSLGKGAFTTKLSSAGLVYAHFGKDVIRRLLLPDAVEEPQLGLLYARLYERFVEEVDAVDNGISQTDQTPRYAVTTTLAARVSGLNPAWNAKDPKPQDEAFLDAVALTGSEFKDRLTYFAHAWLPARDAVALAVSGRQSVDPSGELMVLEGGGLPWKEHVFAMETEGEAGLKPGVLKFVLYPDDSGAWRVQTVPIGPLQGFDSRLGLPEAWRGLRNEELSAASGIGGGIFVHASGFIGGNRTKEGALEMARATLALSNGA